MPHTAERLKPRGSSQGGLRQYTERVVLQAVRLNGSVAKADIARSAGATDVVLVDGDNLAKRVREATGGATIRLGVDAVGGKATDRLARCLAEGGTLVHSSFTKHKDMTDKNSGFVLLDQSPTRVYVAQSGLIAGAAGGSFPTH